MYLHFFLLCLCLIPGIRQLNAQTETPDFSRNGFLREYLRSVYAELEQFQVCPQCPADQYHYLRPVTDIRGGLAWITQPFYPEAYGIKEPQRHPVLAYMQEHLLSTEHPRDKSMLYLVESAEQLQTLQRLIKLYGFP